VSQSFEVLAVCTSVFVTRACDSTMRSREHRNSSYSIVHHHLVGGAHTDF
jgi:hypothetical protein